MAANNSLPKAPLAEETVEAFQLVSATLEKAAQAYQTKQAQDDAIRRLIPDVVDALLINGRIEGEDKEACAKALRDPIKTLELLKFAASHRVAGEGSLPATPASRDGSPVGYGKQASDRRQVRAIGDVSRFSEDADRAYDEALGLR